MPNRRDDTDRRPPRKLKVLPRVRWGPAIRAARDLFLPGNPFGVYAFVIDRKRERGRPLLYDTLSVYVRRKTTDPTTPVPPIEFTHRGRRFTLLPDIIALGATLHAHHAPTEGLVFTGLHPGAAIIARSQLDVTAGVGCLLAAAGSNTPQFLLTAGHIFGPNAPNAPVLAAPSPGESPVVVGAQFFNALDRLPALHMDFSIVCLTQAGVAMAGAVSSNPRIPKLHSVPLLPPKFLAQAFRPTAHDLTPPIPGRRPPGDALFEYPIRPPFVVRDFLNLAAPVTLPGDSGTILTDASTRHGALGTCVGTLPTFGTV